MITNTAVSAENKSKSLIKSDDNVKSLLVPESVFPRENASAGTAITNKGVNMAAILRGAAQALFKVDTDEAVIYDRQYNFLIHLGSERGGQEILYKGLQENPQVQTTFLSACMAVYVVSKEIVCALHVSPSQANNADHALVKPYDQLKSAELPRGTEVLVLVGGHVENLDEAIFMERTQKIGLVVTQLIKGGIRPNSNLEVEFNMKQNAMCVTCLGTAQDDPNGREMLEIVDET